MNELLILLPLLLACGAAAGILAGLLGVGGGIVIVPMLYHVYTGLGIPVDTAMPLSVGTSLSTIILTSVISARSHARRGTVDRAVVRGWALFILLGVGLGMLVANLVSGALLKTLFGGLLILVAVHMLYTARHAAPQLADRLPGRGPQALLAGVVGGFSALLGIGGGTLAVPMLNLFAFPMHRAVGTASVFGFLISVPATLGYILTGWGAAGLPPASTGFVNWLSFAALVPATMLFAPVGVRLCHRLDVRQLKRVFALFLLLVGAKMAVL
ncbi:sulfite exporter TauE/SafE family protein [Thioalbus denitrificans]|uniref:Probable membrane transporter protein n=1 Tax=Thioalbus denitrificans TaxID=547122 RepID=A0A369CFA9_9GAMM|nr:sulfite exporter TauE/SafE family protein [Thioalbus denitrificans]RCX31237.1 putative membrane protein YfcA [Thioalbus denitrificans]